MQVGASSLTPQLRATKHVMALRMTPQVPPRPARLRTHCFRRTKRNRSQAVMLLKTGAFCWLVSDTFEYDPRLILYLVCSLCDMQQRTTRHFVAGDAYDSSDD